MRLSAILVAASLMAGCAYTPPSNPANACSIFKQKYSWYRATRKAQERWGTPKSFQLAIIRQESSFDKSAKPPRGRFLLIFPGKRKSSARGFPQAIDQTWDQYRRATGNSGASRNNFRDAADFVGWYTAQSTRRLGISYADSYSHYIAYHEGWGGYANESFRGKPGLQSVASDVANTAAAYERQLRGCEKTKRNGKTKLRR